MAWPTQEVVVKSLATGNGLDGKVEQVELLGHAGTLPFTQDADGLKVTFPTEKPCEFAYVLKITGLKLK
jgi:alpha-L-fucosidase